MRRTDALRVGTIVVAALLGGANASAETATANPSTADGAAKPLHGSTAGKRLTYESRPPFPRFRFEYPGQYSVVGYDIGAILFGVEKSEQPGFTIGVIPTDLSRMREEAARRHLTLMPPTRQISGYEAVKVAPAGHETSASWMFVTKPYRLDESSADRVRWLIVLPDEEAILSSFRLLD